MTLCYRFTKNGNDATFTKANQNRSREQEGVIWYWCSDVGQNAFSKWVLPVLDLSVYVGELKQSTLWLQHFINTKQLSEKKNATGFLIVEDVCQLIWYLFGGYDNARNHGDSRSVEMSPFERYEMVAGCMSEEEVRLLATISGRYFSIPLGVDVGTPNTSSRKSPMTVVTMYPKLKGYGYSFRQSLA